MASVGLLSVHRKVESPATGRWDRSSIMHSAMKYATNSQSTMDKAPSWIARLMSSGHSMRQTVGCSHSVHGSHTPPAPTPEASVVP